MSISYFEMMVTCRRRWYVAVFIGLDVAFIGRDRNWRLLRGAAGSIPLVLSSSNGACIGTNKKWNIVSLNLIDLRQWFPNGSLLPHWWSVLPHCWLLLSHWWSLLPHWRSLLPPLIEWNYLRRWSRLGRETGDGTPWRQSSRAGATAAPVATRRTCGALCSDFSRADGPLSDELIVNRAQRIIHVKIFTENHVILRLQVERLPAKLIPVQQLAFATYLQIRIAVQKYFQKYNYNKWALLSLLWWI